MVRPSCHRHREKSVCVFLGADCAAVWRLSQCSFLMCVLFLTSPLPPSFFIYLVYDDDDDDDDDDDGIGQGP